VSAQVVVIGAGPTGLTAAILLAQRGIRSVILERHRDVYPLPRAVHLDDEILRILQQAGVADDFTRISRPAAGLRLVDGERRTIVEFSRDKPVGDHGWPQANFFDQPDLERLLRTAAARYPEIELRGATEATRLQHVPDGVRVQFKDTHLHAHYLLGCDGANSMTRRFIGARFRDLRFEERWLVVDVRCDADLDAWDGVHQICDPCRAGTYMRVGADRYRWEFRLRDDETAPTVDLEGLLTPWTGGATVEVLRRAEYTFRAKVADRWRQGRAFLLGDAAHLTPPFIGQGMGSGLRDSANLAWKLALVLNEGADDRLLNTYETERKPHVTRMILGAVALGWAMTGGAAIRRRVITTAARLPRFAELATRTSSPRLVGGPLVPRRHDRLAGSLCPQPWITTPDGPRRLDDLLGDSFVLVHRGEPAPDAAMVARRLGARRVRADDCPELVRWLGGAQAALIRPDRIVLTTFPNGASPTWLSLLPPSRTHRAEERLA
jgi:3-(3-hydroxy-phenyl)propionate hydroxylase